MYFIINSLVGDKYRTSDEGTWSFYFLCLSSYNVNKRGAHVFILITCSFTTITKA